jgi:predicted benzoate:H+ symporter BenE
MSVQVGLVLGISIVVAVLGTASAAAGLTVFRTASWIAAGIVLAAAAVAANVTPRQRLPVVRLHKPAMTHQTNVRKEHA